MELKYKFPPLNRKWFPFCSVIQLTWKFNQLKFCQKMDFLSKKRLACFLWLYGLTAVNILPSIIFFTEEIHLYNNQLIMYVAENTVPGKINQHCCCSDKLAVFIVPFYICFLFAVIHFSQTCWVQRRNTILYWAKCLGVKWYSHFFTGLISSDSLWLQLRATSLLTTSCTGEDCNDKLSWGEGDRPFRQESWMPFEAGAEVGAACFSVSGDGLTATSVTNCAEQKIGICQTICEVPSCPKTNILPRLFPGDIFE